MDTKTSQQILSDTIHNVSMNLIDIVFSEIEQLEDWKKDSLRGQLDTLDKIMGKIRDKLQ